MGLARGHLAGVVRELAALKSQRQRQSAHAQVGRHPLGRVEAIHPPVSSDRALEGRFGAQGALSGS
jgi:hypothetical protein